MPLTVYYDDAKLVRPTFLGGSEWRLQNLQPITVLFGKNGTGKSQVLAAFRDTTIESSHYVVPSRSGEIQVDSGLIPQQLDSINRRNQSAVTDATAYLRYVITRIQAYFLERGRSRSTVTPGNPAEIEAFLSILLPDFTVDLGTGTIIPVVLKRVGLEAAIEINRLSSGEAQVIMLGLDVISMAALWELQSSPRRILLLDEPDVHIHPDLQVRFADFLIQVGRRYDMQIITATHSTTLLSALGQFAEDECGVIYLNKSQADYSAVRFNEQRRKAIALLGGHTLIGALFDVPLLLVEGDDDYRVWSQVPRHGKTEFAVISCGGDKIKQYQRDLETTFASLRETYSEPAGYALLDGDKGLPQPNAKATQDHMRYIKLDCHETENLYLADEVLAHIGTDWATAAPAIEAAAHKFGEKASLLATATRWDRKTADIKAIINQVAQIIDQKQLHWTQRVGVAIGTEKPKGQLADFLGAGVVNNLWR